MVVSTGAGEILFSVLTEDDIIMGRTPEIRIVSKIAKNQAYIPYTLEKR